MASTIYDVLDLGPICACDPELGLLVTVNGSYLNLWVGDLKGGFTNTDCRYLNSENGLYSVTGAEMIDKAEAYLQDVINGDEESESDSDD